MLKEATFMKYALKQAQIAMEKNEVPVGAVVVKDGFVISAAHNLTTLTSDPTAHAEVLAIRKACDVIGNYRLTACELYVTLEPCIMCAGASYWAQLKRIVYGAKDVKRGYSQLTQNVLHPKTEIVSGVMKDECSKLLTDFFERKR